ncbi:unnamed protein product, partial [Ectocarpus fasciculatus]
SIPDTTAPASTAARKSPNDTLREKRRASCDTEVFTLLLQRNIFVRARSLTKYGQAAAAAATTTVAVGVAFPLFPLRALRWQWIRWSR